MEDSATSQKLEANWDSECCMASTSRIESLTLLDALSNRCRIWGLPLVLEMRDLSHVENVFREPNPWTVHCPSRVVAAEAVCARFWSSYTNAVLGGINIGSHAVLSFRQCRALAART